MLYKTQVGTVWSACTWKLLSESSRNPT